MVFSSCYHQTINLPVLPELEPLKTQSGSSLDSWQRTLQISLQILKRTTLYEGVPFEVTTTYSDSFEDSIIGCGYKNEIKHLSLDQVAYVTMKVSQLKNNSENNFLNPRHQKLGDLITSLNQLIEIERSFQYPFISWICGWRESFKNKQIFGIFKSNINLLKLVIDSLKNEKEALEEAMKPPKEDIPQQSLISRIRDIKNAFLSFPQATSSFLITLSQNSYTKLASLLPYYSEVVSV